MWRRAAAVAASAAFRGRVSTLVSASPAASSSSSSSAYGRGGSQWAQYGAALVGAGLLTSLSTSNSEPTPVNFKQMSEASWIRHLAELATTRQIFEEFCSLTDNGTKYMQPQDVLRSLALSPPFQNKKLDSKALAEIATLFAIADTDFDGLISYEEFVFFLKLINTSPDQFMIVFKMFDLDGSGKLDYNEFRQVIRAQGGQPVAPSDSSPPMTGILATWFGKDGTESFGLEDFVAFLRELQFSILKSQFAQYDAKKNGQITGRQFALLVASHSHAVAEMAPAIASLPSNLAEGVVTFEEFLTFERVLADLDDLLVALRFTPATASGHVKKGDFVHAAKVVGRGNLTELQVNIIWHLLDRDGNGTVSSSDMRWWEDVHSQVHREKKPDATLMSAFKGFRDCVQSGSH